MTTQVTKEELEMMYLKYSVRRTAKVLGVSSGTVLKLIDEAGIKRKGKKGNVGRKKKCAIVT